MTRSNLGLLGLTLLLLAAQLLVFRQMTLGEWALAHVHVLALLLMPVRWRPLVLFVIAFALGLALSLVDQPVGAHAVAALNLMAARGWWLQAITPGLAVAREELEFDRQVLGWYVSYLFPLIAVYELTYLPVANYELSLGILGNALLSTLYSGTLCLALVILFIRKR